MTKVYYTAVAIMIFVFGMVYYKMPTMEEVIRERQFEAAIVSVEPAVLDHCITTNDLPAPTIKVKLDRVANIRDEYGVAKPSDTIYLMIVDYRYQTQSQYLKSRDLVIDYLQIFGDRDVRKWQSQGKWKGQGCDIYVAWGLWWDTDSQ